MKLLDRFTTQDGSWDVDITKPYGIDLIHKVNYGAEAAQLGGAHHIYVKAPHYLPLPHFGTLDGKQYEPGHEVGDTDWVNFPIFQSYDPNTQEGAWHVWIGRERITKDGEGIGLPNGHHVSTFLVVGEGEPVPQPPTPDKDKIQLYVNGAVVYSNEG